jgi:D-tyrosyl-tRNA(Tyr) deacylase
MRAVIQRVSAARVTVGDEIAGEIGPGLLVLLGIQQGDTEDDTRWLADKVTSLRIFEDSDGKMNLALTDLPTANLELRSPSASATLPPAPSSIFPSSTTSPPCVLVVSQFTLIASTRKGARPSFNDAARPEAAIPLYESFLRHTQAALGRPVATGRFGAMMEVSLVNHGPVTLMIDSRLRE